MTARIDIALTVYLLIAAITLLLGVTGAQAQILEQAVISPAGTQFVTEDPPATEPVPPVEPNPSVPVAPPVPTQARVQPQPPAPIRVPPSYPAVVLLLDTSDSMLNQVHGHRGTRLDEAKAALKQVVAAMSPQTQLQIWVFNTNSRKLAMPQESGSGFVRVGGFDSPMRRHLADAIDGVKTAGGTNLYRAIVKALALFGVPADQVFYRSGERFPVLIIISDGEDWGKSPERLETVLTAKDEYPLVTVNTVGFNVPQDAGWFEKLCQISTSREGCATADDEVQLRSILDAFYQPRGS